MNYGFGVGVGTLGWRLAHAANSDQAADLIPWIEDCFDGVALPEEAELHDCLAGTRRNSQNGLPSVLCKLHAQLQLADLDEIFAVASDMERRGALTDAYEIFAGLRVAAPERQEGWDGMSRLSLGIADVMDCIRIATLMLTYPAPHGVEALRNGALAAIWLGRFSDARRFIAAMGDHPLSRGVQAIFRREEATWRTKLGDQSVPVSSGAPTSLDIESALARGDGASAALLWKGVMLRRDLGLEEYIAARQMESRIHELGSWMRVNALAPFWRFPSDFRATRIFGNALLRRGDFNGAGAILLRAFANGAPAEPSLASLLVRFSLLAFMGGGLTEAQIGGILAIQTASLEPKLSELVSRCVSLRRERLASRKIRHRSGSSARLAVCLAGQLRSFRQVWPVTFNALRDANVEVFVFTWPNVGSGVGSGPAESPRFLSQRVSAKLVTTLPDFANAGFFKERYPRTWRMLTEDEVVSEEYIREYFGTRHVELGDESAFEAAHVDDLGLLYRGRLNQAKNFYGIHRAHALMRRREAELGKQFDAVLRIRPDRQLISFGIDDLERVLQEPVVLANYFLEHGVSDQVLLGSRVLSESWGDIWPNMAQSRNMTWFPGASGRFSEHHVGEVLSHHGAGVAGFSASRFSGLIRVRTSARDMWQALEADLNARGKIDERDAMVRDAVYACATSEPQ